MFVMTKDCNGVKQLDLSKAQSCFLFFSIPLLKSMTLSAISSSSKSELNISIVLVIPVNPPKKNMVRCQYHILSKFTRWTPFDYFLRLNFLPYRYQSCARLISKSASIPAPDSIINLLTILCRPLLK